MATGSGGYGFLDADAWLRPAVQLPLDCVRSTIKAASSGRRNRSRGVAAATVIDERSRVRILPLSQGVMHHDRVPRIRRHFAMRRPPQALVSSRAGERQAFECGRLDSLHLEAGDRGDGSAHRRLKEEERFADGGPEKIS